MYHCVHVRLLLLLAALGLQGIYCAQQAEADSGHCESIPPTMELCHGIEYSEMLMRLPNLLGHERMEEAVQQAGAWTPLLHKHCHADARRFLCSLFAPVCIDELDGPVLPCRSLCLQVRQGCSPLMSAFGFPWPDMLECSRFPEDNDLCIPPADPGQQVPATPHELKICDACKESEQNDNEIVEEYCKNDFALKIKVQEISYRNGDAVIVPETKSKTVYRLNGVTEKDLKKSVLWLKGGLQCICDEMNDINAAYLVMGQKLDGNLIITSVKRWQKGQREFKRIARNIRKQKC